MSNKMNVKTIGGLDREIGKWPKTYVELSERFKYTHALEIKGRRVLVFGLLTKYFFSKPNIE